MLTAQQKLEILCAYLPHGVEAQSPTGTIFKIGIHTIIRGNNTGVRTIETAIADDYRPILRHPDDMTEDEVLNLVHVITGINNTVIVDAINCLCLRVYISNIDEAAELTLLQSIKYLRYLHSIHIDTFGAIEAGWAIRKEVSNG